MIVHKSMARLATWALTVMMTLATMAALAEAETLGPDHRGCQEGRHVARSMGPKQLWRERGI